MGQDNIVMNANMDTDALQALNQAALAIAGELDSNRVLQLIVDTARELADARYAALGIPSAGGGLSRFIHSGLSKEQVAQIDHLPEGKGLLGEIVRGKASIRVDNIANDTRSVGFPQGHPDMTSFLGVPIFAGKEVLGNLYLTEKKCGKLFSESDQRLVELLSSHAAIAIQNAHLYEQVEQLAVLEERSRIGMDLHDGVIQSIYAVGLTLESARISREGEDQELTRLLEVAIEGLNEAIRDIRNFILDLRPRRFSGDLNASLGQLVREFQANTMTPVDKFVQPNLTDLSTAQARALYLTTQEALANVARHARASKVMLRLRREKGVVRLVVEDNGRGFDLERRSRMVGHGLANMQARAEDLGGRFVLDSSPGHGTKVIVEIRDSN